MRKRKLRQKKLVSVFLTSLLLATFMNGIFFFNDAKVFANETPLLIDQIRPAVVAEGDGLYYTTDRIQRDNEGNLVVPELYYYRGLNPKNWIEYGQVSEEDDTPILWRIISWSEEGLKIIYEGPKTDVTPENLLNMGSILRTRWGVSNVWETVQLKTQLADWHANGFFVADRSGYEKPIHWPIALVQNSNPNTVAFFLEHERKDITIDTVFYPGVTTELTAVGLINPSQYIMGSSNPLANESVGSPIDTSLQAGVDNYLRKGADGDSAGYVWWTNNAYNGTAGNSWHIGAVGRVSYSFATSEGNSHGIRPVINLKEDLFYISGTGTMDHPYVISTVGQVVLGDQNPPAVPETGESGGSMIIPGVALGSVLLVVLSVYEGLVSKKRRSNRAF